MRKDLMVLMIFTFSTTLAQAGDYKSNDWYIMSHDGCVPMVEMYEAFPGFAGAKTPQAWLDKLRSIPVGRGNPITIEPIKPSDAELKPYVDLVKQENLDAKARPEKSSRFQAMFTKTNAIALTFKNHDEKIVFFLGDLCKELDVLQHGGSK